MHSETVSPSANLYVQFGVVYTADKRIYLLMELLKPKYTYALYEYNIYDLKEKGIISLQNGQIGAYKPFVTNYITLVAYAVYSGLVRSERQITGEELGVIYEQYKTDLLSGKLDNFNLCWRDTYGETTSN